MTSLLRRVGRLAAVACVWLVIAMPAMSAWQEASLRIVIVQLASTSRSGATGSGIAQSRTIMAVGDSKESWFYANVVGDKPVSMGGAEKREYWPVPSQYTHSWRVLVQVAAIEGDKTTLDVSWSREDSGDPAAPPYFTDRRTITLKSGQRHVLDFVNVEDPGSKTANVVLDVELPLDGPFDPDPIERARRSLEGRGPGAAGKEQAGRTQAENPDAGRKVLDYSVWLVHELGAAGKIARRIDISGQDSLMARFTFEPLRFSLDAAAAAEDPNGPVTVAVSGGVMGRVRADGSLEVTLLTMRGMTCSGGMTVQESGVKMFSARPGETTAVDLPWTWGYCPLGPDLRMPARPRPGVIVDEHRRRVEFKEFFAGQRTSILVTATVRQP